MKLLLKSADGKCVSVTVFQNDTFSDLKTRVAEEDNIDIDIDDFCIEGRPVENNLNVIEYFQLNTETVNGMVEDKNVNKNLKSHTCRLCAGNFQCNGLIDAFQIMDKIGSYLPIQIKKDDKLSKLICVACFKKLDEMKKFIDSCIEAERKQLLTLSMGSQEIKFKDCPICLSNDSKERSHANTLGFPDPKSSGNQNVKNLKLGEKVKTLEETEFGDGEKSKTEEVDGMQIFCFVCKKKVKLSSALKSECHGSDKFSCFFCQAILKEDIEILEHLKIHFIEIISMEENQVSWKCSKCEMVSNDGNLLEKHFKSHRTDLEKGKVNCDDNKKRIDNCSQKQIYRCHLCSKSFRCKNRLEFHIKFHVRGSKAGQCSECRKEFATELCLYKHMLYNHLDPRVFTCEHCGKSFRNKSSLTYHFRSHSSLEAMKPFNCDICKKRFARKNILRDHMMNRHGSGMEVQPRTCFQCHVCKEVFPNTDSAISHVEIHHPEKVDEKVGYSFDMLTINKLFICEFCDKCFSLPINLIEHRLHHSDTAKYQCKMCNEEFASFVDLKSHQENHVSDGIADYKQDFNISTLFMCQFCEKCFKNFQAFNIHCKNHTGKKPYKCRFCPEVFSTYKDSTNHRLSKHVEEKNALFTTECLKPFECPYCSKAFTSGSTLTKHIRIHTGEKPFPCHICNRSFAQSSGLYTHLKVHSNDRPYQCDLCERSFKILGDYKQHIRRHSGIRSYLCEVCKKAFKTQRSLSQHKRIHTNLGSYVCDLCHQAFRRSRTLEIHKLRHARSR